MGVSGHIKITVVPEVYVSASHTRVIPGQTVTLTCTVARAVPTNYMYNWSFGDDIIPGRNTTTFNQSFLNSADTGNYTCAVTNDAGVGRKSVTIECK